MADNNIDIFGICETFLKNDKKVRINGFKWLEKNRHGKGGGGIGFLISDEVRIIDDNLFNSAEDDYESMWVKVKVTNNSFVYLACVYFPVEGTDPNLSDELYNQILSDVLKIQDADDNDEPNIVIMGDFNGRIGDNVGDCTRKCRGRITWFRHPYSSTIDYFLASNTLFRCIDSMIVDEERDHNIGSDHNMLFLKVTFNDAKNDRHKINDKVVWNIKKDQDYTYYRNEINFQFSEWNVDSFDDQDSLWSSWKNKLLNAANKTVGLKSSNCNQKQWWDKTIDAAIKERKRYCKAHCRWATSGSSDRDEGDGLWKDYFDRKTSVKKLIHNKIMQLRIDRSVKVAQEGGLSSTDVWFNLRGSKSKSNSVYSLKLPN